MNDPARYTAEWLEKNCDAEIPFERAVKRELGRLLQSNAELQRMLRLARAQLASHLQELAVCHTSPVTGLVEDQPVLPILESEQDLINQIDEVLISAMAGTTQEDA